ncbi:hypothetical protein ATANTOWER_004453 [Ataeniobius toweri]|uniref:Uncharacterized protein n=1 Tax=Ataeniobius toweri TaxID=208326 RepID=A0ABU7B7B0_9TELE|nr:hypothetical protein [Ataeniobius toweri]
MNHGKRWTAKDTHNASFKSGKRRTHLSAASDRPSAPRCDVISPQVHTWKDPAPELVRIGPPYNEPPRGDLPARLYEQQAQKPCPPPGAVVTQLQLAFAEPPACCGKAQLTDS